MTDPMDRPSGLKLFEQVITPGEETQLIALIEASGLAYPPYDPGNRRASASFGYKYDFATDSFRRCPPMPEPLLRLRERAADAAGVAPEDIPEVLFNRYEPGAVIQPHRDKPQWEHVVGISLGAAATMRFTRGEDVAEVLLEPRSMYLLAGDARYVWEHSLPPAEGTRYSITYRSLSQQGRLLLAQTA
jgi:alkylated DNA repair protein (DNA oxidative demethylase)